MNLFENIYQEMQKLKIMTETAYTKEVVAKDVGQMLILIRRNANFSQKELAIILKYNYSMISKVENGKYVNVQFVESLLSTQHTKLKLTEDMRMELELCKNRLIQIEAESKIKPPILSDTHPPDENQNRTDNTVVQADVGVRQPSDTAESMMEKMYNSIVLFLKQIKLFVLYFFVILLIILLREWILKWQESYYLDNPPAIERLGDLDYDAGCRDQYPQFPNVKSVLQIVDDHQYDYQCLITTNNKQKLDMDKACQYQYLFDAKSDYTLEMEKSTSLWIYHWYCYRFK